MHNRIRDLREDNDVTQEKLSDLLNCKQQTYSNYENGKREIPYELLIKLAEFYNTSTDYLLGITDIKDPYPKR